MPRSGVAAPTRSRGGCLRCKSRHVKCDEGRPECQVCRSNKIKCPGYEKKFRWSAKHERLHARARNDTTAEASHRPSEQPDNSPLNDRGDDQVASVETARLDELLDQADSRWIDMPDDSLLANLPNAWSDIEGFGYQAMMDFTSTMSDIQGNVPSSYAGWADLALGELTLYDLNGPYGRPSQERSLSSADPPPAANHAQSQQSSGLQDASPRSASTATGRYLQTYYRQTSLGTITGYSDEDLVHHYFKHVCALFSCFGSSMNPFRDMVSAHWRSSAALSLSIQSMSAAHLANYYPCLAPLALRKRSQAWIFLQRDLHQHKTREVPTDVMSLNLMLLGLSSSWHQASRVGMQHIVIARNLLRRKIEEQEDESAVEFFQKGLMYWEMLLSFIDPIPITALPGRLILEPPKNPSSLSSHIIPHSWTGVVTEVYFAMAEIGRVLRRQRTSIGAPTTGASPSSDDAMPASFDVAFANDLDVFLVSIKMPSIDMIVDLHDQRTSKDDLVRVAIAYRLAGLLEIYSLFPDIAQQHINNATIVDGFNFGCYAQGPSKRDTVVKCLASLAKHMLFQVLEPITIYSGANRTLSLLYVIIASHLRPTTAYDTEPEDDEDIHARSLIEERMLGLSRRYPQRPQLQMLDIIREGWHRLDGGNMRAHWLNVLHDRGMQTMMG